ncbi:outer membrane beta-barrel domain protein [Ehrlichia chaffeensis str. Liberty]|uniref:P44/Msp2 family outer membrane protein n=1 Tax=Ehrlichia chaffeensis TaxID=945 RepID=UPI000444B862|nr:P44/Msp2 family outer membrane protein [Ehrlichia chaffeensis]AHX05150.1 outer membrane beta-barrel domain protein [Ehrlichia chaffeensis str. Jax]AHX06139.1 outer membrane beta-barrel domain protein [Ehrlichia chaffeensis str. Liberty]
MNNKKSIITGTVLASLLLLSSIESSSAVSHNHIRTNTGGIYITGQYRPGVSHFTNFSVKETTTDTKVLVSYKKEQTSIDLTAHSNFNGIYTVKFQDNAASFSGAIGYSYTEGLRLEVEGSYETFDVKDPKDYSAKDAFRFFALARPTSSTPPIENYKYTVMKNNGLSVASIMINGCYDLSFNNVVVSPYICAGIGEDFIEFFDTLHIKFAYQGKLGISYYLSPKINIFADGYYHRVIGNKFKNLNVNHVVELTDFPKPTSAVATLNVAYFGGEAGVKLTF